MASSTPAPSPRSWSKPMPNRHGPEALSAPHLPAPGLHRLRRPGPRGRGPDDGRRVRRHVRGLIPTAPIPTARRRRPSPSPPPPNHRPVLSARSGFSRAGWQVPFICDPCTSRHTPLAAFPSRVVSRPPEPASCQGRFPEGSLRPFACRCAPPPFWGGLWPTPERPHRASCNWKARRTL